jgi:ABC-2 type transport system permease protein
MNATPITPTTRPSGASALRSIGLIATRNAKTVARVPSMLVSAAIVPVLMIVLMSQVFRGIAANPAFPVGLDYIDYLTPAILAMVVIANASNSAVGIASDLSTGMLDRLRAMPVRSWTVFVGRSAADVLVSIGQVALVIAVAVVLGFAPDGSIPELLAGLGLILFLGLAFNGLFMIFGTAIRNPESVNAAASALLFPLLFVSSAFAPPETMPDWMRATAEVNPLSLVADASRGLFAGAPSSSDILAALLGTTAVLVIGTIAASHAYRRVSS